MIIAIANQKGGVGKTTTTLNLGVYLASMGKKVLLIDSDPQSNLTSGLGYGYKINDDKNKPSKSIYDILSQDAALSETYIATQHDNLFLVPSTIELAGAEVELVGQMSREAILKNALSEYHEKFDYVFIDCPPSLGILTINALVASDAVYIPVQCEYFALEGLGQLINTVNLVRKRLNNQLKVGGVIMTMFDARTNLSKQVTDEIHKFFGEKVFETIIPRNVRLSEAPSHGKPIMEYDPSSQGAQAYKSLAKEVIDRNETN